MFALISINVFIFRKLVKDFSSFVIHVLQFVKLIWSYSWYALFAGKYFVNLIHCTLNYGYLLVLKYCWIIKKDSWVQDIEKVIVLITTT